MNQLAAALSSCEAAPCNLQVSLPFLAEVAFANWTVKAQHPLMVMVAPADKALQVCPPGKTAGTCKGEGASVEALRARPCANACW